jgi:hypothetical protein
VRDDACPIASLVPHPDNDNVGDLDAIEESIRSKGQYKSIIVQASTRHICAGNHTWQAMQRLGATTISADFVDVPDDVALEILLADNATARHATTTADATAAILAKLAAMRPAGADVLRGTGLAGLSGTEAILKRLRAAPSFLGGAGGGDGEPMEVTFEPDGEDGDGPSDEDDEGDEGDEPPESDRPERPAETPRHPLSIVLTNSEKRRWDARKDALGERGDKGALWALLDQLDARRHHGVLRQDLADAHGV